MTDDEPAIPKAEPETCDYCGSTELQWIKCKLVCRNCRQIVMSCADLAGAPSDLSFSE